MTWVSRLEYTAAPGPRPVLDILPASALRTSTLQHGQLGASTVGSNLDSISRSSSARQLIRYNRGLNRLGGLDLKYDNCHVPPDWADECEACTAWIGSPLLYHNGTCPTEENICAAGYNYTASSSAQRYRAMGDALAAQNRTIQFNICVWGYAGVEEWGNQTGNSWRISTDIEGEPDPRFHPSPTHHPLQACSSPVGSPGSPGTADIGADDVPEIAGRWPYITAILNINSFKMGAVGFWGHNDADMLEVGSGELSPAESRSHFAFWAATKSPLIIGADLTTLSAAHRDVLTNEYLVAFNQDDVHGGPAAPYRWGRLPDWTWNETHPAQYWAGESRQGTFVLLLNPYGDAEDMTVDFGEVPSLEANGTYHILDAWTGDCLGSFTDSATVSVASHDTAVLVFQYCGKYLS